MKRSLILTALVALAALCGCGDDEGNTGAVGPAIGAPTLTCGPWLGEERTNHDGDFLQRVEVTVTDPNLDVAQVTMTWRGAIFALQSGDDGLYSLDLATMTQTPAALLRCEPPAPVLIRAQDTAGNVAELTFDPDEA